jgi:hypothetical protein
VYCLSRYTGQQQSHDESIDSFASGSTGAEDVPNSSGRGKLRKMSKNEHTTSNNSNSSNHGTHSASPSLSDGGTFPESKPACKQTNQPLSAVDEDVEQPSRQSIDKYNNDYHQYQNRQHQQHYGGSSAPVPVNYANTENVTSSTQQQQRQLPNGQNINRVATHQPIPTNLDMDVSYNKHSGHFNNAPPSRPVITSGRDIDRREQPSPVDAKLTSTSNDRSITSHPQPSQVPTLQQSNSNRKDTTPTSTQKKKGFWGRMFTGGGK